MAEKNFEKKSLIQRAEEELKKMRDFDSVMESKDRESLIHDLKVHQIELEMQNDELRRAQKELEKTKNVYANLYNLAPVGYVTLDSNGIILKSNQTFSEMTGVDISEINGTGFINFLDDESRKVFLGRYKAFFKNPESKSIDAFLRNNTGSPIAVRINGKRDNLSRLQKNENEKERLLLLISDICEQKRAEEALQESENRYRTLFESAADAIMIHDYEGRILQVNRSASERLGYSIEEFKNLTLRDIDTQLYKDKIEERAKELKATKSLIFESEHISKSGTVYPVEISCKEIEYRGKTAILSMSRDIRERKEAEKKIQSLLNDKEILLKEVHHRIKNNMNTIAGLLYIQAETMSDACGAAAIQDARNRVFLMMNLYDKLYRSTDFRNVSTAEYLYSLIGEISMTYSNDNRIKIEKEIEDFVIDSKLLFPAGMIINELISNAFKYAFPEEQKGTVKVYFTRPEKGLVSLIVSDDGTGISENIDLGNSSGFGLTLVNMLVTQLKGSADIIRKNGTTFRISFPVQGE